jgi:hypothetical protein
VFSQTLIDPDSDIKPVVGLHFAGEDTYGVECKIQNVFDRLNLTILCDGAYGSVFDWLFGAVTEGEQAGAPFRPLSPPARPVAIPFSPLTFARKERGLARARSLHSGISRDMQKRLMTSRRGRVITDFVAQNRAELLSLFARDGDVRRAALAAIGPLVAGAKTTTDVLERRVTVGDMERLEKLGKELTRKGGPKVRSALRRLRALKPSAEGDSLAKVLKIKL